MKDRRSYTLRPRSKVLAAGLAGLLAGFLVPVYRALAIFLLGSSGELPISDEVWWVLSLGLACGGLLLAVQMLYRQPYEVRVTEDGTAELVGVFRTRRVKSDEILRLELRRVDDLEWGTATALRIVFRNGSVSFDHFPEARGLAADLSTRNPSVQVRNF